MPVQVERDIAKLLPCFQTKVRALVEALQARGFKPKVHETWRSPERAAFLRSQGKSKTPTGKLSMHCYGVAADLICDDHAWDCAKHRCAFFKALGEEAWKLGLTWGGDWDGDLGTPEDFVDSPHVQAIPIRLQKKLRALPDDAARDAFVADFFAKRAA